jgi:hypothetical protein
MAQLARPLTEISRSAGTWFSNANTGNLADDLRIPDPALGLASPSTVATHILKVAFGPNWNGTPLVRPATNRDWVLRVDARYVTNATSLIVKVVEDVAGDSYSTVRDTWNIGTLPASVFNFFRRPLAAAVVDTIVDITKVGIIYEFTVGTSGNRGSALYTSLVLPDAQGNRRGRVYFDFRGMQRLPPFFETFPTSGTTTPALPIFSAGGIELPSTASIRFVCYHSDLPRDCRAAIRFAGTYDVAKLMGGPLVRQVKEWDVTGSSGNAFCFDFVNNTPASEWELTKDGGAPDTPVVNVPFGTEPNAKPKTKVGVQAVGDQVTGYIDDREVARMTHTGVPEPGNVGFALAGISATSTPWPAVESFEAESVPPPQQARLAVNQRV